MRWTLLPLVLLAARPLLAQQPRVTAIPAVTTAEFRGLHVVDDRVLWASGSGGRYVRSVDGGATWKADSVPGAASLFFVDVHAFDASTAVLVGTDFNGGEARIYRTTDGGATWTQTWAMRHANVFLDGVAFWDTRRGVAFSDPVDGAFLVLRTEDGGGSWQPVPADRLPPPLPGEAAFAASGTNLAVQPGGRGWIATGGGAHARVLHTPDFGASWAAQDTPLPGAASAGIFGIAFRDAREGVAVGGDYQQATQPAPNVLRTRDGGRSWELAGMTSPPGVKYGIAWQGEYVIAPAPAGTAYSTDGGRAWQPLTATSYNTAAFAPGGAAWLAGVNGGIARVDFVREK